MSLRAFTLATLLLVSRSAVAAPLVWVIDDGEKIKEDAIATGLATGVGNPVWSPGEPIRLFAMKNESVAFQVVVTAKDAFVDGVTIDLDMLATDSGARIQNAPGATNPAQYVGRPIERFVEHFLTVQRASGGNHPRESLGWASGSGPPPEKWTGRLPDALVPIEVAPTWLPYPMTVAPHMNALMWIDITVPKSQTPGLYKGVVEVRAKTQPLASLAIELEVVDVTLPDRTAATMLYYEHESLERRIGTGGAAEQHLWRLLHRHRLSPLHTAVTTEEVEHHLAALDGSFYTAANGYAGPAEAMGDGVLGLGMYGAFGAPNPGKLAVVERITDLVASKSLLAVTDTFVYAKDEDCSSPWGAQWKRALANSTNVNARKVRVAWTCSEDATKQPVDIPIQLGTFDPAKTAKARAMGKEVWVYNGQQPHSASFSLDTAAINPRVNGWLQGMFDIGRWFEWEIAFWYDGNRGGKGPYDPFVSAETFHNADGDWGMGDGVLVYPGKQVDSFSSHSIGLDGVIASIRLKNWRRGIEDAGYYRLAHAVDAAKAEAIATRLLPVVLSAAKDGDPPSWSDAGKPWFDGRKALLEIIKAHPPAPADAYGKPPPPPPMPKPTGCGRGCGSCSAASTDGGPIGSAIVVAMLLWRRRAVASVGAWVRRRSTLRRCSM